MSKTKYICALLAVLSSCFTQCPAGVKPSKPKIVPDNNFIGFFKGISDPYVAMKLLATPDRFFEDEFVTYYTQTTPYVETLSQIDVSSIDLKSLPSPYNQLDSLKPYNADGFYLNSKWIEIIFKNNTIINAVEIGSFAGLSTRHIASQLSSNGKLYAVDIWDYFSKLETYPKDRFDAFLSNVIRFGLYNAIIPIKTFADQAALQFQQNNQTFDFMYIDGDHSTEGVLQDLVSYYPLLNEKGIMSGDDWLLKSVRIALVQFAQEHNLTIYSAGNFWFFKKENGFVIKDLNSAPVDAYIF